MPEPVVNIQESVVNIQESFLPCFLRLLVLLVTTAAIFPFHGGFQLPLLLFFLFAFSSFLSFFNFSAAGLVLSISGSDSLAAPAEAVADSVTSASSATTSVGAIPGEAAGTSASGASTSVGAIAAEPTSAGVEAVLGPTSAGVS